MKRKPQGTELPPTNERPAHNRFWFNFFWLMKSSCLGILCCWKDILRLIIIAVRGSLRSWSGQGSSWRVHLNPWGQPLSLVSRVNCFHLRKVSPLKLSPRSGFAKTAPGHSRMSGEQAPWRVLVPSIWLCLWGFEFQDDSFTTVGKGHLSLLSTSHSLHQILQGAT